MKKTQIHQWNLSTPHFKQKIYLQISTQNITSYVFSNFIMEISKLAFQVPEISIFASNNLKYYQKSFSLF